MNRVRNFILGGAAFTLAAVVVTNVPMGWGQDQGPGKRPFARSQRMHGGFAGAPLVSIALNHKTELNLGSDQVANLEKVKNHYQSQVTPLQQQLTAIEKEIATLSQQSPADLIQIKAKIQEAEKYRSELRYLRVEALENGRAVLTAQQQEQLKTLVRSRHERFRTQQSQPS
jgi:Spy/CpxP family protein refolding chaperone